MLIFILNSCKDYFFSKIIYLQIVFLWQKRKISVLHKL